DVQRRQDNAWNETEVRAMLPGESSSGRMFPYAIAASLLGALCLAGCAVCDPETWQLNGRVTSATGEPIYDAVIWSRRGNGSTAVARTDEHGSYAFEVLPDAPNRGCAFPEAHVVKLGCSEAKISPSYPLQSSQNVVLNCSDSCVGSRRV